MTTEKRQQDSNSMDQSISKRQRTEKAKEMIQQLTKNLAEATEEAGPIELSILKETILVNRKYWPELKKVYLKRDEIIWKQKNLWGSILCSHPQIEDEFLISPIEVSFICNHLEKAELNDYLDDNGSYEIRFVFDEAAEEFVEPIEWVKKVIMKDDCETVDEEKSICTKMTFKTDGMNPIKAVQEMRKSCSEDLAQSDKADACADEMPIYSLATWFSEIKPSLAGEFGEVFRKVVYVNPEAAISSALNEDDDDEEDEAGDEENSTSGGVTAEAQ